MLDSRINYNFNRPIVSPQFRASQNVSKPVEAEEKQGMSSTAKWAIGLGLTALASYGVYYALTKGRGKAPKPTPPSPNPTHPLDDIKGMAVNIFKKEGKFDKGKALLNGENYTGNIISECKDGSKVVMEYVDGVLQKSTKIAKDGTKIFDKAYRYDKKGLRSITKNYEPVFHLARLDGKNIINTPNGTYTIDTRKNRIISSEFNGQGLKKYLYSSDNELKAIKMNGEIHILDKTGRNVEIIIAGNNYKFYDKDGKLIEEIIYDLPSVWKQNLHYDNLHWEEEIGAITENCFEINKNGVKGRYHTLKRDMFSRKKPLIRKFVLEYNGNKYTISGKDENFVIEKAGSGSNYFLEVNENEYNEVLEQAKSLMQELKSKYKKAIKLKDKAKEAWWINHSFNIGCTTSLKH